MNIIDAYDLISLVSAMNSSPIKLPARKINQISACLSQNGNECRFVVHSFETIALEYPDCLTVSRRSIFISRPSQLKNINNRQLDDSVIRIIKGVLENE